MAKIEVVKQQDLKDCGACCLSSIIKYYDGYIPLEKIRDDTCTNMNGTTAYHLLKAAKNYGFDGVGVQVEKLEDQNLYFPAIAHLTLKNGLNHFVVIYKVTKKEVWLMDPAKGKVKMSKQDFLTIWNHIILLLTPITKIIHYNEKLNIPTLLIELLKKNREIFNSICIINLLLMFFTILNSFYFQIALSSIQNGEDLNYLKWIIGLFFCIVLLKIIFHYLKNYYMNYLNKNLDVEIFSDFLTHIFYLPLKFMQNRTTGEIISRVQELSEIKNLMADFFTNVLLNSILMIGSVITLYFLSSKLLGMLILISLLYISISLLLNKIIGKKIKENIEATTDFNSVLVENIEMNTSIKNLNLTENFLKRLEDKLILMLRKNFETENILNSINLWKNTIYEIGLFLVLSLGIYFVYQGDLTLLHLITFNSVLYYLMNPMKEIIDLMPKVDYLIHSFNKLKDFINVPIEEQKGLTKILNGDVNVQNVTYSYNLYENVLKNVSFIIRKSEKVLINGPSGSGKSTLCQLLCGFDANYKGIIKLNNTSEQDYCLYAIKEHITYVGQNERLFSGTIKDNICCYRNIEEKAFLDIARICHLEDIVKSRPNRYQTFINASINNLSGGEKQRITLARALLKKANIIILDEALSEVNLELEKEIIRNIKEYFKEEIIIYVSHKNVESEFEKIINLGVCNVGNI